jgi:hypothetical protein
MPAVPQIQKIILLTLDSEDFSLDVVDAAVVPTPGAVQTARTLDGVTHQDIESETWALNLTCVLDWDSARPGLAYFLNDRKGETVAFLLKDTTAANSAGKPAITGDVVLHPIQYGGPGNVFATATISLPLEGIPTLDATP